MSFQSAEGADLELALPPSFTEVTPIQVGTETHGLIGYDSTSRLAFLAFRSPPPAGATDPLGDEEALRPALEAVGALRNRTAQTFKTWEGFDAVQAFCYHLSSHTSANVSKLRHFTRNVNKVSPPGGALSIRNTPCCSIHRRCRRAQIPTLQQPDEMSEMARSLTSPGQLPVSFPSTARAHLGRRAPPLERP